MKIKNNKGFTLVELLVVIAIIGILAVIAVPNMINYVNRAKISEFKTEINSFELAMESFYLENDRMPEDDEEWSQAVKDNVDGNYKIEDGKLKFKSVFNSEYHFNFINTLDDKKVPVYRIDIGGFTVNKNIADLLEKDEYCRQKDISVSYSNDDNDKNKGTIWVLMNKPE